MTVRPAKPLETTFWLNSPAPITIDALRGKVVLLEAFQMLCPGCVSHALPQAMRVRRVFSEDDVAVIGLHTVFEHHSAQGSKDALAAFLHEYRIPFPVGMDAPADHGGPPKTMTSYGMQGTPTTILIDQHGRVRKHKFGREEDMILGAEIMALLRERGPSAEIQDGYSDARSDGPPGDGVCDDEGCPVRGDVQTPL